MNCAASVSTVPCAVKLKLPPLICAASMATAAGFEPKCACRCGTFSSCIQFPTMQASTR